MKFLILIIACTTFIFSQEGQVTNVVAQQRTDGSQIVDISYDLLPDEQFPSFTVLPYISTDEGETYELLNINLVYDLFFSTFNKSVTYWRMNTFLMPTI